MTAPAPPAPPATPEPKLPTLRDLLARAHLRLILFAVALATASLVLSGVMVIRSYAQRNLELVESVIGPSPLSPPAARSPASLRLSYLLR